MKVQICMVVTVGLWISFGCFLIVSLCLIMSAFFHRDIPSGYLDIKLSLLFFIISLFAIVGARFTENKTDKMIKYQREGNGGGISNIKM